MPVGCIGLPRDAPTIGPTSSGPASLRCSFHLAIASMHKLSVATSGRGEPVWLHRLHDAVYVACLALEHLWARQLGPLGKQWPRLRIHLIEVAGHEVTLSPDGRFRS